MAPWRCRLNGVVLSGSPWLRWFGEISGFLSTRFVPYAGDGGAAPSRRVRRCHDLCPCQDLCPCNCSPVLSQSRIILSLSMQEPRHIIYAIPLLGLCLCNSCPVLARICAPVLLLPSLPELAGCSCSCCLGSRLWHMYLCIPLLGT
ncbi:hypothetical protein VPH35_074030 [Triticum aestivum]